MFLFLFICEKFFKRIINTLNKRNLLQVMSENISAAISVNGEIVMKQPLIKSMRVVKKETLKLISDWVSRTNDHQMVSFFTRV